MAGHFVTTHIVEHDETLPWLSSSPTPLYHNKRRLEDVSIPFKVDTSFSNAKGGPQPSYSKNNTGSDSDTWTISTSGDTYSIFESDHDSGSDTDTIICEDHLSPNEAEERLAEARVPDIVTEKENAHGVCDSREAGWHTSDGWGSVGNGGKDINRKFDKSSIPNGLKDASQGRDERDRDDEDRNIENTKDQQLEIDPFAKTDPHLTGAYFARDSITQYLDDYHTAISSLNAGSLQYVMNLSRVPEPVTNSLHDNVIIFLKHVEKVDPDIFHLPWLNVLAGAPNDALLNKLNIANIISLPGSIDILTFDDLEQHCRDRGIGLHTSQYGAMKRYNWWLLGEYCYWRARGDYNSILHKNYHHFQHVRTPLCANQLQWRTPEDDNAVVHGGLAWDHETCTAYRIDNKPICAQCSLLLPEYVDEDLEPIWRERQTAIPSVLEYKSEHFGAVELEDPGTIPVTGMRYAPVQLVHAHPSVLETAHQHYGAIELGEPGDAADDIYDQDMMERPTASPKGGRSFRMFRLGIGNGGLLKSSGIWTKRKDIH